MNNYPSTIKSILTRARSESQIAKDVYSIKKVLNLKTQKYGPEIKSNFQNINTQMDHLDNTMGAFLAKERNNSSNCFKAQMKNLKDSTNTLAM